MALWVTYAVETELAAYALLTVPAELNVPVATTELLGAGIIGYGTIDVATGKDEDM